jgi:hypothetical protein
MIRSAYDYIYKNDLFAFFDGLLMCPVILAIFWEHFLAFYSACIEKYHWWWYQKNIYLLVITVVTNCRRQTEG